MTRNDTFADINKRLADPVLGCVMVAQSYFFEQLYTKDQILNELAYLTLAYEPTLKSLIQMQYQTEKRKSTLNNQNFDFNSISFTARFNF